MLCKICELRIKFFSEVIRVSDNITSFATQQINRPKLDMNKDFHANGPIIAFISKIVWNYLCLDRNIKQHSKIWPIR